MSYLARARTRRRDDELHERDEITPTIAGTPEYELHEGNERSLTALYARLRAIYDTPDFDSPAMRADRSQINQTILQMKDATDGAA